MNEDGTAAFAGIDTVFTVEAPHRIHARAGIAAFQPQAQQVSPQGRLVVVNEAGARMQHRQVIDEECFARLQAQFQAGLICDALDRVERLSLGVGERLPQYLAPGILMCSEPTACCRARRRCAGVACHVKRRQRRTATRCGL